MAAQSVNVHYSTNSGQTWKAINGWKYGADPVGGGGVTDFIPRRMHVGATARKFRFRVKGAYASGEIGKLAFRYKEAYTQL